MPASNVSSTSYSWNALRFFAICFFSFATCFENLPFVRRAAPLRRGIASVYPFVSRKYTEARQPAYRSTSLKSARRS